MPSSLSARPDRLARGAAALLLALVASACQVKIDVAVDADDPHDGELVATVTLDADAARRLPDLEDQLAVDDLTAAGWVVEGPDAVDGGGVRVVARHGFSDPEDLAALADQLSGENGPFEDFELKQERSFLRTRTTFTGTVDFSAGAEAFSDPALAERLGGEPFGVSEEELDNQLGVVLDRVFAISVAARLPGSVRSNAPAATEGGAIWRPGVGEVATLTATGERLNTGSIVWSAVAGLAAVAALVVGLRQSAIRRRRR